MPFGAGGADQFSAYFGLPGQSGKGDAANSATEFRRTGVNPTCARNGAISATMKKCGHAGKISIIAFAIDAPRRIPTRR